MDLCLNKYGNSALSPAIQIKRRTRKHIKSCGATAMRRHVFEEHLMVTDQSYRPADCLHITMLLTSCMIVLP